MHLSGRSFFHDPAVAQKLLPSQVIGCKRLCVDTGYYATFNRPNVTLVDLREEPIEAITASGIQTTRSKFDVDAIVFATGFDAMTGALLAIDIRGAGGRSLREGPKGRAPIRPRDRGSPTLHRHRSGQPFGAVEHGSVDRQHVEWIAGCIARLDGRLRSHRSGSACRGRLIA
jgi:cyclohexanone monooxygenase